MYGQIAFQPSQYSGMSAYGVASIDFPCIKQGADDQYAGGAVSAVQEALRLEGKSPLTPGSGDPLGVFGPATDAAVRQFQSEQGLDSDGIVGPLTGAKLGLKFQSCSTVVQQGGPTKSDEKPPSIMDNIRKYAILYPGVVWGGGLLALLAVGTGVALYINRDESM